MLMSLSIKNVVLIDQLVIDFKQGLCALTGETGAGKSILLDSLGLALGVRAESGLVRHGANSANVTASFQIPDNHEAYSILEEADIIVDDDMLLMRRVVYNSGKSRAFVNDQPVSVGLLKRVGDSLVEIHGQFETQGLLNPQTHRAMLDEYAQIKGTLAAFWNDWKDHEQALDDLYKMSERAHREEEYLRISLEDLDQLSPEQGEEKDLAALRERLKNRDNVLEALNTSATILGNEYDPVQQAWAELDKIANKCGDDLDGAISALSRASAEIAEAAAIIQGMSTDLQDQNDNLEEIDDRLYALRMQARKHQCSVDDLPELRVEIAKQLNMIEHADDVLSAQKKECAVARKSYVEHAEKLSQKRRSVAEKLNKLVQKELIPLKLEKARFVTHIEVLDEVEWNVHGIDRVRFLVSTNPGREPGPIHKIASGGEMSRFMLALKVVIAQVGSTHSFIFDEVDTGIGGATADAVGERLARLADSKQVLVVTHAPQVAARADNHWIVKKSGKAEVKTDIIPLLTREQRCEEIARMLAGADITAEARAAAHKLLDNAA
ncbi:MAG: DNA repair protein RecN [Zetaproteobacteria bacterium]|nr:MAG: DNA repair protein RecN [Zetaproteobacteria bacterium]